MNRVAVAIIELIVILSVVSVMGHVFVEYEAEPGPDSGVWAEARIVVDGPVDPAEIHRDADVINYSDLPPSEKQIFEKAENYGTLKKSGMYKAGAVNMSLMSVEYVNWHGGYYSVHLTVQEKPQTGSLLVGIRHIIKLGMGVVCGAILVAGLSDVIARCGRWRDVRWVYEIIRG